ncbi:MAG: ParB N-terminal domain-containing protein [Planctomycetes bacterium]|nr:ParB N-terminal domain-containing protein [Planctomycetota bacterium]
MVTTKRYDYVPIEHVLEHPLVANHRELNESKVAHYQDDILKNGLLEPLVVWERRPREYFLVGGFHRLNAIKRIRKARPGYYDRVDVRVVTGEIEEIRALNLKLNADRLDAKISDYFDTILFLNNANWSVERIAAFLDKKEAWVEEILRYVPGMDSRVRALLHEGKLSWGKAKGICRRVLQCEPGDERKVVDAALRELEGGGKPEPRYVLTPKVAQKRLRQHLERDPKATYAVSAQDLYSLLTLLAGKVDGDDERERHLERVREIFPSLVE